MANAPVSRTVVVKNREGLHARPAFILSKLANEFASTIELIRGSEPVDAKSILSILTLGAECGTEILIRASGEDAESAVAALVDLFESEFGLQSENDATN